MSQMRGAMPDVGNGAPGSLAHQLAVQFAARVPARRGWVDVDAHKLGTLSEEPERRQLQRVRNHRLCQAAATRREPRVLGIDGEAVHDEHASDVTGIVALAERGLLLRRQVVLELLQPLHQCGHRRVAGRQVSRLLLGGDLLLATFRELGRAPALSARRRGAIAVSLGGAQLAHHRDRLIEPDALNDRGAVARPLGAAGGASGCAIDRRRPRDRTRTMHCRDARQGAQDDEEDERGPLAQRDTSVTPSCALRAVEHSEGEVAEQPCDGDEKPVGEGAGQKETVSVDVLREERGAVSSRESGVGGSGNWAPGKRGRLPHVGFGRIVLDHGGAVVVRAGAADVVGIGARRIADVAIWWREWRSRRHRRERSRGGCGGRRWWQRQSVHCGGDGGGTGRLRRSTTLPKSMSALW